MKKCDRVIIELTPADVYHLHSICTHYYLTAALSRDDLPVIGKVSRAFECVVDDVPVDLLYPGAIASIIRDIQKADQCTEDWLRERKERNVK